MKNSTATAPVARKEEWEIDNHDRLAARGISRHSPEARRLRLADAFGDCD